jgi:hemolysin activation/secretion protein
VKVLFHSLQYILIFFALGRLEVIGQNAPRDYSSQEFKRSVTELQSRVDAFNQKLVNRLKSRTVPQYPPYSTAKPRVKNPSKLFDELFPPYDAKIEKPPSPLPKKPRSVPTSPSSNSKTVTYPVMPLRISYGGDSLGLPSLREFEGIRFRSATTKGMVVLATLMKDNSSAKPFQLSAEDLREISQICIHFLKEKGYEGMVAMVDPSQIDPSTGNDVRPPGQTVLDLKVWVARVSEVRLDYSASDNNKSRQKIERVLAKQMWKQSILGQPLHQKFLKTIKRLGRNPGKSSRLLLLPSTRPGEVEAVVEVKGQKRARVSVGVANNGSPSTGKWLWGGQFRLHELTRSDDPVDITWTVSDTGQRYGLGMGYRIPLVQPGVLDLGVTGMYSEYDGSSFALTPIEFQGSSKSTGLTLYGNPLSWERKKSTFSYQLGLNYQKVEAYNSIFQENAGGTFLTPLLSFAMERKGSIVRSISSITLQSNIHSIPVDQREFMGGFEVEDKVPVLSISHKSMLNLSKLFNPSKDPYAPMDRHSLWFDFEFATALSNQRMLPEKQWLLGGSSGVRGYPEAIVAGDHGFLFSIEYRWKLLALGSTPMKRFSLSVAPFFDYGQSFVKDPFFYESDQTLIGLGCGLLTELPGGGQARLDFAKPLKTVETDTGIREGTQSHDYRVHASTQWTF